MADGFGQKITFGFGGAPLQRMELPKAVKPPKIAAQHVENFSEFNMGKQVPKPKIQKIQGQTFRT